MRGRAIGLIAAAMTLGLGTHSLSIAAEALSGMDALKECGADCRGFLDQLSAADADEMRALPEQVVATLDATMDRATLPSDPAANALAKKLQDGAFDLGFAKIKTGKRPCTVYWYGFLDNASERVGRHQCRVTRTADTLTIEKTTGDGLKALVHPYGQKTKAFIGRTYLPEQKRRAYDKANPANSGNENYGNKVGIVLADKGRLYLLSTNERGFTEPDPTFFEIIAIE